MPQRQRGCACAQVDAFTSTRFQGNPAAVCLLRHPLDDETLQKIAAEENLSETAFLERVTDRCCCMMAVLQHLDMSSWYPQLTTTYGVMQPLQAQMVHAHDGGAPVRACDAGIRSSPHRRCKSLSM
jgi:hypothetical protein